MLADLAPNSALLKVLSMAPRVVRNAAATVCSALTGSGGIALAAALGFGVGRVSGLAAAGAAGRFVWEIGAGFGWASLEVMSVSRKVRGDLNCEERSFGALAALIGLAEAGAGSRAGGFDSALASALAG